MTKLGVLDKKGCEFFKTEIGNRIMIYPRPPKMALC